MPSFFYNCLTINGFYFAPNPDRERNGNIGGENYLKLPPDAGKRLEDAIREQELQETFLIQFINNRGVEMGITEEYFTKEELERIVAYILDAVNDDTSTGQDKLKEIEDGINIFLAEKVVTDQKEEKKIRRFLEQLVNAYEKEISEKIS